MLQLLYSDPPIFLSQVGERRNWLSVIISLSRSHCCSDGPGYRNRDGEDLGPVAAQPLGRVHHRPRFQGAPPGGHHPTGGVSQWLLARAALQRDGQTLPAGPGGNWHRSICRDLLFFFLIDFVIFFTLVASSQEAVVTARFSAISTGTLVNGVWYKPVEQFILPKVSSLVFLFSRLLKPGRETDRQTERESFQHVWLWLFIASKRWITVSAGLIPRNWAQQPPSSQRYRFMSHPPAIYSVLWNLRDFQVDIKGAFCAVKTKWKLKIASL